MRLDHFILRTASDEPNVIAKDKFNEESLPSKSILEEVVWRVSEKWGTGDHYLAD
jgi:hypothetical protein